MALGSLQISVPMAAVHVKLFGTQVNNSNLLFYRKKGSVASLLTELCYSLLAAVSDFLYLLKFFIASVVQYLIYIIGWHRR